MGIKVGKGSKPVSAGKPKAPLMDTKNGMKMKPLCAAKKNGGRTA